MKFIPITIAVITRMMRIEFISGMNPVAATILFSDVMACEKKMQVDNLLETTCLKKQPATRKHDI
jgi:hypothetical protein